MATETRDVLVKIEIDRKGADTGLGAIKTKGEQATKSLKDTKKAADNTGKSMTSLAADTKIMGVSVNSLSAGFTSMRAVIGKAIVSLKIFKTALISTGIGALVIAAGALVVFLTRMQSGMDIVSKAMAQLGAVVDVVLDRLGNLGKVIISFGKAVVLALKGDFVGAVEAAKLAGQELKEVFTGIGQEIADDVKLAGELADAMVEIEEREIANIALQAERRRDIAKLLLLAKDETKSAEERLKAAEKAAALEKSILETNVKLQKDRVDLLFLELERSESSREDERAFAQEKAKLFQLEEASLKKLRAISLETLKFQRLVIAEALAAEEQRKLNAKIEEIERQLNHERSLARPREELVEFELASLGKIRIKKQEIATIIELSQAKLDAETNLAKLQAKQEKAIAQQKADALLGFVKQGLESQKGFIKVAFLFNQGLSISKIFISTREAIAKATADVPFPLSLVVGAFYAALGLAQAAAVAGVKFAKGGIVPGKGAVSSTGDHVMVRANPGEVFLNDNQQAALGGAPTFRKIGVPGFQGGGVVPGASIPSDIIGNDLDRFTDSIAKLKIVATIEDINEGQERVAIVDNRATIKA